MSTVMQQLQELYGEVAKVTQLLGMLDERMDRLDGRLDRMEAVVGSAPPKAGYSGNTAPLGGDGVSQDDGTFAIDNEDEMFQAAEEGDDDGDFEDDDGDRVISEVPGRLEVRSAKVRHPKARRQMIYPGVPLRAKLQKQLLTLIKRQKLQEDHAAWLAVLRTPEHVDEVAGMPKIPKVPALEISEGPSFSEGPLGVLREAIRSVVAAARDAEDLQKVLRDVKLVVSQESFVALKNPNKLK